MLTWLKKHFFNFSQIFCRWCRVRWRYVEIVPMGGPMFWSLFKTSLVLISVEYFVVGAAYVDGMSKLSDRNLQIRSALIKLEKKLTCPRTWWDLLCISTSERVLHMPYAGQNFLFPHFNIFYKQNKQFTKEHELAFFEEAKL